MSKIMRKLSMKDVLLLYGLMCRARARQETLIIHRGKVPGPELTAMGQEAMGVVPLFVLLKLGILRESVYHGDHRAIFGNIEVVDELIENEEEKLALDLLRNYFSRITGGNRGRCGNQHVLWPEHNLLGLGSSDMGPWVGVLLGFLKEKMRAMDWDNLPQEKRPVGLAYFGDGASNQGIIHEAMNWSWRFRLPAIFCINNNQRALFTSPEDGHGNTELYRRAGGYGDMVGMRVDGTDPAAIWSAMVKAVEHAQSRVPVLIECMTDRLTGHNEDHIKRVSRPEELQEKRDFFNVKDITGLDKEELAQFRAAALHEPLRRTQQWLAKNRMLPHNECCGDPLHDPIIDEEREKADALVAKVLNEPKITVGEDDKRGHDVFPPLLPPRAYLTKKTNEVKRMKYNEAYGFIVSNLLREDGAVTYLGEDVRKGGVLALTAGIPDELKKGRVEDTPISEEMIAADAAGSGLADGFPIREFQFGGFGAPVFRILRHLVAPQWYEKGCRFKFMLVYPSGIVHDGGSGEYHERWPERELLTMSGIAIIAPANAYEVVGLARAAYESGWPVALILQISAAIGSEFASDVPLDPYTIPFGKAHIMREGTDFTVVVYGAACVAAACKEAEFLAKEGISVKVINLRTVHPWDKEMIIKSVQKTGRMCFMHEDYYKGGVGQMLKGELMEEEGVLDCLRLPKIHVLGASTPFYPTDIELSKNRLPYTVVVSEDGKQKYHRSPKLAAIIKDSMEWS